MTIPKISVVMSVYNGERFLAEAITSILNQTFKDFEFIIINDGSTDNSLKIIKDYMNKDKRILLVNNNNNLGLTKSLNKGLKIARGKYIARMDADDVSLPKRFEIQYNFLEKKQKFFLVSTAAYDIDSCGKIIGFHIPYPFFRLVKWRLKTKNCIYHPTIMFRNQKGIVYNEFYKYSQDYAFYLYLIKNKKSIVGIPRFLLKYRINPQSISISKEKEQGYFDRLTKKNLL